MCQSRLQAIGLLTVEFAACPLLVRADTVLQFTQDENSLANDIRVARGSPLESNTPNGHARLLHENCP